MLSGGRVGIGSVKKRRHARTFVSSGATSSVRVATRRLVLVRTRSQLETGALFCSGRIVDMVGPPRWRDGLP